MNEYIQALDDFKKAILKTYASTLEVSKLVRISNEYFSEMNYRMYKIKRKEIEANRIVKLKQPQK